MATPSMQPHAKCARHQPFDGGTPISAAQQTHHDEAVEAPAKAHAIRWLVSLAMTFALVMLVVGCNKDPLSSANSPRPPAPSDLAGTYVPDAATITTLLAPAGTSSTPPVIHLSSDLKVSITGIKDLGLREFDGQTVKGDEVQGVGDVDRNDDHWVILAETIEILIVRDKPPYGLEVMVGKPGQERALRFERQAPAK